MADLPSRAAEDALFSTQLANLLLTLRNRRLSFQVAPTVWRRLGKALYDWQRPAIARTLKLDWDLLKNICSVRLNEVETGQLMQSLADWASVKRFDHDVASKKERSRSDADAERFYLTSILRHPKGMPWLRTRQPKGMTLVDRTLHLFTTSMDLCLERIEEDRDYLARCFLDGNAIERLVDLVVTDSDPHKGGRRVAFLDLTFRASGKTLRRRVVYKPSDVEIDYRIVGKNTAELKQLFEAERARGIFPEPHESFLELLDRLRLGAIDERLAGEWSEDAPTRERLMTLLSSPTYVILPRNPGSRMKPEEQTKRIAIDRSYGYLEYLPFHPAAPELGFVMPDVAQDMLEAYAADPKRWSPDPFAPADASDWILDDSLLAKPAFRLWGRLMSIACVFLQTDLHHQNQRLRGLKPHIIDLENCLVKTCPVPGGDAGTMMPESLLKVAAAAGPGLPSAGTANQLYLRENGTTRLSSLRDPEAALQVKEGMREALTAMAAVREEIAHWAQASGIGSVVVRHVAQPTGNLVTGLGTFFGHQLDPRNREKDTNDILKEFLEDRRADAVQMWKRAQSAYVKEDNPAYGLEVPAYNGRDFEDRCIPVYYRQAGALDLLTWRGEAVKYEQQAGDTKKMAFTTYHQHKGTDLLASSLTAKLPKDEASLRRQVEAFIDSTFASTPHHVVGAVE